MTRTVTIGVDIGTSGCKATVLGSGGALQTAAIPIPTRRRVDGEVSQDPADWLRAVRRALRACAATLDGVRVAGIGITAPAHVGVLVDGRGDALTRSLLAFDGRPAATAARLRQTYGARLQELTFVELTAGWTLSQLHWLREQHPALWPRVRWLLTQKDYVRYRMTGRALIDPSDAAGTAMLDQRAGIWLDAVCRDAGLGPDQLPPIVPALSSAGGLTAAWARATGLVAGTPVVVGATDTAAELVSVGAREPGHALVKIASTGTVVGITREPVVDRRLLTYPHALPGRWYTLGATNAAATAYAWLRETMFAAAPASPPATYAEMDRCASRVPAGSAGVMFLPFLQGERTPYWDTDLRAAFVGVSSGHDRDHLARAVLEGVALALRECRDVMREAGIAIERPVLAGGGMASRLWRTMLVSALGGPGRMVEPQGPAVGAAMLAAGMEATDPWAAMRQISTVRVRRIEPRKDWIAAYDALYEIHGMAVASVAEVSHRLVALAREPAHGGGST